jgi:RNA polymerase sigma-70 factor (ECF subfamily)
VGDPQTAEDLTQETFLRVYRARKRYRPRAKFVTWLFTIAHNLAFKSLRTRRGRRREVSLDGGSSGVLGPRPVEQLLQVTSGQLPARQLEKAEMAELVRLAMDTLNDRQRMAVLLCKFAGLRYAEIGEVMDLSPVAVKSLLLRARVRLRDILEPYVHDGNWRL